jgi:hypothetical protein
MKRHLLDPFSLVFGALFTTIGLTFLISRVDIGTLHLRWVWPLPLIVLGAVIIFLAARGERAGRE